MVANVLDKRTIKKSLFPKVTLNENPYLAQKLKVFSEKYKC